MPERVFIIGAGCTAFIKVCFTTDSYLGVMDDTDNVLLLDGIPLCAIAERFEVDERRMYQSFPLQLK